MQQRGWASSGTATLELTELGANEFARLAELVSADRTTLMIGIAPGEYASTVSVLERMARNLRLGAAKSWGTLIDSSIRTVFTSKRLGSEFG